MKRSLFLYTIIRFLMWEGIFWFAEEDTVEGYLMTLQKNIKEHDSVIKHVLIESEENES